MSLLTMLYVLCMSVVDSSIYYVFVTQATVLFLRVGVYVERKIVNRRSNFLHSHCFLL
jgi:hypothetical protein